MGVLPGPEGVVDAAGVEPSSAIAVMCPEIWQRAPRRLFVCLASSESLLDAGFDFGFATGSVESTSMVRRVRTLRA
jgi:hypothetical protein